MRIFNFVLTRAVNVLPEARLNHIRKNLLVSCDLVIDVGANNGDWIGSLRNRGFTKKAICIEPQITEFEKLKKSQSGSETVCLNTAIGNKVGKEKINVTSNRGLSSSLLKLAEYHLAADKDIQVIHQESINITRLSSVLREIREKNVYLKVDTQGYELEVFKSINKKDWGRIKFIEVEVNLVDTYQNAPKIEEILKFLRAKNYDPIRIENGFGMPNFGRILQCDIILQKNSII